MAFFTTAATVVLILTLRSANKTNSAAIEAARAAKEANEIIRSEHRPWVTLEFESPCCFTDDGKGFSSINWTRHFVNKGKSPAYKIVNAYGIFKFRSTIDSEKFLADHLKSHLDWHSKNVLPSPRGAFLSMATHLPDMFPGERIDQPNQLTKHFGQRHGVTGYDEQDLHVVISIISYNISPHHQSRRGYEARLFTIHPNPTFLGPAGHNIMESYDIRMTR